MRPPENEGPANTAKLSEAINMRKMPVRNAGKRLARLSKANNIPFTKATHMPKWVKVGTQKSEGAKASVAKRMAYEIFIISVLGRCNRWKGERQAIGSFGSRDFLGTK